MILKNFSRYLHNNGLPIFWQQFVLVNFILSVSIAFLDTSFSYHLANITMLFLTMFAFGYQLIKNNRSLFLWGSLFLGVILIKISILLQEIVFFGLVVNNQIPFLIEQFGIILVSLFALSVMFLFEKKFRINGFITDLSLLILSATILLLLTSPKLLNGFLQLEIHQYLLIIKILFGIILFTMMMFIHFFSREFILHNVVFSIATLLITLYFSMTFFKDLNLFNIDSKILLSVYQLSGVFILIFAFTEKVSIYSKFRYSHTLGSTLMFVASVAAICTIPLSILIRWNFNLKSIDTTIIGISSFILSSIVIWRLTVIIRNTQEQAKELKQIAYTDSLTLLPNYHGLIEKIDSYQLNKLLAIAVNIDDFRSINDLYGRKFGDDVLISLAQRLKKLPRLVTASRAGTDLFFIIYKIDDLNVHFLIQDIQKRLGVWDTVSGKRIAVPLTFGISYDKNIIEPQKLIQQAEKALSEAKVKHSNYSIYYKNNNDKLPRHKLREILQHAIEQDYLPVHFQPIYNVKNGSLKAMELLIRIQSRENGILLPGQFLEQAQAYGLLTPLTKICVSMIARNYDQLPNVIININLPSYMLDSPRILNEFLAHFAETKLPANRFCIEVMEDQDIPAEHLLKAMKRLKTFGFSIAMDDFGTGYSSLSRLSMLPFDIIKIDRSLLLAASAGNKSILESAIKLIKRLELFVVVEGVETTEQLALIQLLGADFAQGFLLSKPVEVEKAKSFPLNATNIIAEF